MPKTSDTGRFGTSYSVIRLLTVCIADVLVRLIAVFLPFEGTRTPEPWTHIKRENSPKQPFSRS